MTHSTIKDVYGPGTFTDTQFIPVPKDVHRLLQYLANATPGFETDPNVLGDVEFHGNDLPMLPGPIKAQVLSAVLAAMIGIVGKEICGTKGVDTGKISVDTDHAGLYPASASLISIDGKNVGEMTADNSLFHTGTDLDHGVMNSTPLFYRAWSLYPTRDPKVYYQIMSNLNPAPFLQAYGIDPQTKCGSLAEAYEYLKTVFGEYSARELEQKNMEHGFCGQTCFSPQAWRDTLMGKTLARHPIINYSRVPEVPYLPPIPFPLVAGDSRPLAGIKIVEMARVIATPAGGASLAALGAEIVKVESPNLPDPNPLQMTLTAGKYTCSIDLNKEADRKKLWALLEGADVVLQAYRRRAVERRGFGLNDVLTMANKRGKGIVYMDMTCYGPDGTYAERPGYQQIADSASGCCYVIGKSYGYDEGVAVLPSLPIADMLSGAGAALGVMLALRDRAKHGGSYHVDIALTAINTVQLTEEFGLYPPEIVQKIQHTHKFAKMTPEQHVEELLGVVIRGWAESTDVFKRKELWSHFKESPFGNDHFILAPVVKYENASATPAWKHSPVPYCYNEEVEWAH